MNKLTHTVMAFLATCQVFMLMLSAVFHFPPVITWAPAILAVAFCVFLWLVVLVVAKVLGDIFRAIFSKLQCKVDPEPGRMTSWTTSALTITEPRSTGTCGSQLRCSWTARWLRT